MFMSKRFVKALLSMVALAVIIGPSLIAGYNYLSPNGLPTASQAPHYDAFQAVTDPGKASSDYFKPYWYADTVKVGPTAGQGAHHIQAHGGNILPVMENGQKVYYWYGESHEYGYSNSPGVHVYKSTDLYNWRDQGIALRTISSTDQLNNTRNSDYNYFNSLYGNQKNAVARYLLTNGDSNGDGKTDQLTAIIERPKVIYNHNTKQYVMWFHSDGSTTVGGSNYARALLGVATSSQPTGPFKLVGAYKGYNDNDDNAGGWGELGDARDMTAYVASDGNAYVGYSSEGNTTTYVAKLDSTWTHLNKTTNVDQSQSKMQYSSDGQYPIILATSQSGPVRGKDFQIVANDRREAIGFLEFNGKTYAITSGTTGWNPNLQTWYVSNGGILGVYGEGKRLTRGVDSNEGSADTRNTTFGSQLASILPYDQSKGEFIYVGDRWDSGAADSTYVVLPIIIRANGDLSMANPGRWTLDYWDKLGVSYNKPANQPHSPSHPQSSNSQHPGQGQSSRPDSVKYTISQDSAKASNEAQSSNVDGSTADANGNIDGLQSNRPSFGR